jgi:hypothetical protein
MAKMALILEDSDIRALGVGGFESRPNDYSLLDS